MEEEKKTGAAKEEEPEKTKVKLGYQTISGSRIDGCSGCGDLYSDFFPDFQISGVIGINQSCYTESSGYYRRVCSGISLKSGDDVF
ncbi:MAG: hypothetical protein V8R46_00435 [Eubacterium ramulus]